ncbi:DsrE family protein [Denitrobaculum tricleocarpae]|uniref:Uncharacterized protein n=1 Tax=Denitrobaculum tricleocarpae TaxID=2591009 RepID=A0A545TX77_9PROT|nr:DsrE family protein [Denitrobaculum tricleocarpae]TQV81800.1 hypothetical protein FKG95_06045 [Denitrobaculum tricleocarpae]
MKKLLAILLLTSAGALGLGPAAASSDKADLFVVVTSPDPQTQGMAMVLSLQAVQQGADVQMLLCGPGGDVALKGAPQTVLKPRDVTPQAMLTKLVGMGVKPNVCALYLPNNGKSPADLIEGVGVAKPPAIAAALLAEDTKLFTF